MKMEIKTISKKPQSTYETGGTLDQWEEQGFVKKILQQLILMLR